jgi:uncharacterized OB-fold protein/acyl dehydratase
MSDADDATFLAGLQAHVGATGTPVAARDAVNEPMIRHWCDAMEDANPNYTDHEHAATGPHGTLSAPPTMLNAWTMLGNIPRVLDPNDPQGGVNARLDAAGYVGVVATNSEHVYKRYLRPGDLITSVQKLVDVSEEKQTGLGIGHFVTTETEYYDQTGEHVGSMFFRILKFRPGTGRQAAATTGGAERPKRPRPSSNPDSEWFWEGCRQHELRVQTFTDGTTVYPPMVRNPYTGEMPDTPEWQVSTGHGTLYSYAIPHHPQVPAFDYPLVVGLVELVEGVRIVSNVIGCTPAQVEVGMPLEVCWLKADDDIVLPQFRPARPERRIATRTFDEVEAGDKLPLCAIPLTPTLIVSAAIASRDYQAVHHDRDDAQNKGSKDIFMNILTSSGLSGRYISDWAGPDAVFKNLKLRLGAPNYPYDIMTLSGSVAKKEIVDDEGIVTIAYQGLNSLGAHVTGTADIALPLVAPARS